MRLISGFKSKYNAKIKRKSDENIKWMSHSLAYLQLRKAFSLDSCKCCCFMCKLVRKQFLVSKSESNPGPLAHKAKIVPLDQQARHAVGCLDNIFNLLLSWLSWCNNTCSVLGSYLSNFARLMLLFVALQESNSDLELTRGILSE